jgi:asparagine synthase (glutamine-hydrolysing)
VSGIVGIVNLDGARVDARLLSRLTDVLKQSGPDAQRIWVGGSVGLGHALLASVDEPVPAFQPLTVDGRSWITADARIDGRADLVRKLSAAGCVGLCEATDAQLILHAYRTWNDACVEHLLGDFAFAIWDAPRRRLVCARDHFGVKPFFYAEGAGLFVFGSSLDAVRRHGGVSSALDETALVDFLAAGGIQDPAATSFRQVRRLPAACRLVVDGGVEVHRYWQLPLDGHVRYRRGREYVEHFAMVLEQAVADRLRTRRVGVLMSGGIDSTTVAATAKRCLARESSPFALRAYMAACERVVRDPEPRYAAVAAAALGIPLHTRAVDGYEPFERWDKPELHRAEPEGDPLLAIHVDQLNDAVANGRVLLTGHGGDPAVRLPVSYAVNLYRRGHLGRLLAEVGRYVVHCRRLPRVRVGVHVRRWLAGEQRGREAPAWLKGRPSQAAADAAVPVHPTRPDAYALLTSPDWPQIFETYDANTTGVPIDVRHPLFDRRLVEYLLAIPPMPWCFDKTVVRLAMRGTLPEPVRWRPKTVAAGDPLVALLKAPGAQWIDDFVATPALRRYVDRDRIPRVCGERDSGAIWTNLRPLCLNHWLQSHDVS